MGTDAIMLTRHPVLLITLIVVLAIAAAHAVLWVTVPLLWLAFGVVAVVIATRLLGSGLLT